MPKDLHELPKLRDSISYLYMEHAKIEQEDSSIVAIREDGRIPIPVSSVTCLLLGPGTRVTHAAIKAAADNGCMIIWCGERMSRFYASGVLSPLSVLNVVERIDSSNLIYSHIAPLQFFRALKNDFLGSFLAFLHKLSALFYGKFSKISCFFAEKQEILLSLVVRRPSLP